MLSSSEREGGLEVGRLAQPVERGVVRRRRQARGVTGDMASWVARSGITGGRRDHPRRIPGVCPLDPLPAHSRGLGRGCGGGGRDIPAQQPSRCQSPVIAVCMIV